MSKRIVDRLSATEEGEYPHWVTVSGPKGEVSYLPAGKCTTKVVKYVNICAEVHLCSSCGKRTAMGQAPKFCPRCGAEVKEVRRR